MKVTGTVKRQEIPAEEVGKEPQLVHSLEPENEENNMSQPAMKRVVIGVYALLVVLGVLTGYLLSRSQKAGGIEAATPGFIQTETVVGSTDTKTFRDSAEGVIEKDGFEGEGSHKLIREGGPSQTAYLISSVVDLDQYVGKKVKVYGETIAAKKVAWLMDVGKIELAKE